MATLRRSTRSRRGLASRRTLSSRGKKIRQPEEFRGSGAVSTARRKIAKGARKISPELNRDIVSKDRY